MSLYRRKDSPYWWVKLSVNGRTVQKSTGIAERRKAKELHDRWAAQVWDEVKLGRKPRRTWDEAVLQWLQESTHRKSRQTDLFHLRWLQQHLEGLELEAIDREKWESMIAAGLSEGVSNTTVNRRLQVARTILRKAVLDWEWLEKVPRMRFLKEPKGRTRYLTKDQAARLLLELPEHLQAMAGFALCTGLRQGNVKRLRWSRVDMQRRVAWVDANEAKAGKALTVPLDDLALSILRKRWGRHPEYVFTYEGRPVEQVTTKAWRGALQRAGIEDFHWHDLRHTWASWHVENDTPLLILQKLGGWSDLEMVQRYAHLSAGHLAVYADRMSRHEPLSLPSGSYDLATSNTIQ